MNEYTMELVDRFAALLEEVTELRTKVELLHNTVKAAEISDALYKERNKGDSWIRFDYDGRLDTEQINAIMGWRRSEEATAIIEGLRAEKRKEAEDGDAVRTDE